MIQNKFLDGGYKLITGGAPPWRWLWWVFLMQESTCFSTTTKQDNRQYIWMYLDIFDDIWCTWGHQRALNVLVNLNESHRKASQHWFPFDKSLFFPQLCWVTHGHTFQTITHFLRTYGYGWSIQQPSVVFFLATSLRPLGIGVGEWSQRSRELFLPWGRPRSTILALTKYVAQRAMWPGRKGVAWG